MIDSNKESMDFGGLVRPTIEFKNRINTFLEGNPGIDYWYYAVGMFECVYDKWKNAGFPTYMLDHSNLVVSLWIKLPYPVHSIFSCNEHKTTNYGYWALFTTIYLLKSS